MSSTDTDTRTGLKTKPQSGYMEGVMNHIKCCEGAGVFALGFSLKNAGMAIGPPLLILVGLLLLHCQHILLKAGKEVEKQLGRRPDFAETGKGVFEYGPQRLKKVQYIMPAISNFILLLSQTGLLCVGVVFFAESMMKIALNFGYMGLTVKMWVLIAFLPIFITTITLGNLKVIAYLSFFANVLLFSGIAITIYILSTDLPEEFAFEWVGDVTKIPIFISMGVYAFTSIQIVLPYYIEAKHPEQVGGACGVITISSSIEIFLNLFVGVLSYLRYGVECQGSVTLNFEPTVIAYVVVILVGLSVMFTYTLLCYISVEAIFPILSDRWGPFKHPRVYIFGVRLIYILFTFILSWSLPMLGQLVALVGATGNTSLSIILPALFHMVIMWETSSVLVKIKDFLILLLGICSLVAGLIGVIMDIIIEIHTVYDTRTAGDTTKSLAVPHIVHFFPNH